MEPVQVRLVDTDTEDFSSGSLASNNQSEISQEPSTERKRSIISTFGKFYLVLSQPNGSH